MSIIIHVQSICEQSGSTVKEQRPRHGWYKYNQMASFTVTKKHQRPTPHFERSLPSDLFGTPHAGVATSQNFTPLLRTVLLFLERLLIS